MQLIDTDSISEDIPVSDRFAYLAAVDEYVRVEELPSGHGYVDVVFIPKKGSAKPAMLVEIKWDEPVDAAIAQIKDRNYPRVLEELGLRSRNSFSKAEILNIVHEKE